jgi:hypothetical protein
MKLPNGENAVVEIDKFAEYLLNPDHPRRKHKARVFAATCGLTAERTESLRDQLLAAAHDGDAIERFSDEFGRRFMIEWIVGGPAGQAAMLTAWILRRGESFPRFVSGYIR